MIAGKDAYCPGEAKNSWLTGTAAWNYFAITQYILGIRPQYNGLLIDPCIPSDWKSYTVIRRFRGTTYKIEINNRNGSTKGVKQIKVDGKVITGNLVPLVYSDNMVNVEVEM